MSINEQEWQVRSPAHACGRCSAAFKDGDAFFSRLCFEPEAGYTRHDYCTVCSLEAFSDGAVSAWKTVFHSTPPPEEPLKKETAESMLRQLMETDDPSKLNAVFVLAVMLERRRIFVERDVQMLDDGTKRRIYEHRGTSETFVITDPQLKLRDLERVQEEVVLLLGGRPPERPGAPPAPPAPAPDPEPVAPAAPEPAG